MNKTVAELSLNSEKNTFPEYANLGMSVIQLLLLLGYWIKKLTKRVTNIEARLQSMRNKNDQRTEL